MVEVDKQRQYGGSGCIDRMIMGRKVVEVEHRCNGKIVIEVKDSGSDKMVMEVESQLWGRGNGEVVVTMVAVADVELY